MRVDFWKRTGWNGANWVRIICDKCHSVIGEEPDGSDDPMALRYAGLNTGTHECTTCRKARERAYDRWVTSPHRCTPECG